MRRKLIIVLTATLILQHLYSQQFKVRYTAASFEGPFTGKVFLYLSKGDHFTVATPEYRDKGVKFLAETYKEWQKINLKGF